MVIKLGAGNVGRLLLVLVRLFMGQMFETATSANFFVF